MSFIKRASMPPAVLLAAIGLSVAAGATERSSPPFAPGEKLSYSVTWSVFQAGQVTATLLQNNDSPHDDYDLITIARSQGFVSILYKIYDQYRSRFDATSTCSEGISKSIAEGRRLKQTIIVFDETRHMAVLDEKDLAKHGEPAKHQENPVPACVQDVVSAFYYLRNQSMRVGEGIKVPVNDGSKTREVTVEVQTRELIDTPLGRRYAFRVEPTVFGSLYTPKGRMLIWFSDDKNRLPLRIKAKISIGTITGTLQSVTEVPSVAEPRLPPVTGRFKE